MKTVFARIGICLEVTDEEYKNFKEDRYVNEDNISDELAERFLKNGELSGDSYIPESQYDFD